MQLFLSFFLFVKIMVGVTCGIVTSVIGAVLVAVITSVTFAVVPGVIDNIIEGEVILIDDTIQFERFEAVPFPLNFTVRIWNISNPDEVLNGSVPALTELGPYIYKIYLTRNTENLEGDEITYRIKNNYEFDAVSSFPNTEDDVVTIANVAYNSILQVAESMFPQLMGILNNGLGGIFGVHNSPIMQIRVRDLLFDGVPLCENTGIVSFVACNQVRQIGQNAQNLHEKEDGSLSFSLLSHRDDTLSKEYVVHRGLENSADLGRIIRFDSWPRMDYWTGNDSVCNMLNGTDSQIFPPFVDRDTSLYALNTDICRSVELRYQYDLEYEGIPAVRYAVKEWFLDNSEGCFCLNVTPGITRENGCLLRGAQELYTCVGAFLVLSYPHFLYADFQYRNGIIGMNPIEEEHRIFLDIEPKTGTIVRGAKRGQFNVFLRPITGIAATQNLRTSLTPIFWVEEGMSLPEEFVNEIKSRLLLPLNIVDILLPILVALSGVLLLVGLIIIVRAKSKKSDVLTT